LGSRPELAFGLSSNLMRSADFLRFLSEFRRFGANLLKLSKFGLPVKERLDPNHDG